MSSADELLRSCVHCGLCLEACPTYRELRVEMDSPRGRIYLMKGLIEESIEPTEETLRHLDQCLDCRACETACPSGVRYGEILEETRTHLEAGRKRAPLLRWFLFKKLLPSRRMQRLTLKLMWLIHPLTYIGQFFPGKLGNAAKQAPRFPFRSFRETNPAVVGKGRKVALFTGCLADQLFRDVNEATVKVLVAMGCEVHVIKEESCCGALHIHNGERQAGIDLCRRNIEVFKDFDVVISNAAGCSAELRPVLGSKVKDISEFLLEIDAKPVRRLDKKVAYDDPCHLLHAQKLSAAPLLRKFVNLVPLEDADTCCGSAGIYSIVEPELSRAILARKAEAIRKSGAEIVATGNPGCILQLRNAGLPVRVCHPIELFAEVCE